MQKIRERNDKDHSRSGKEKFVQKYLTGPALLEMGGYAVYQELPVSLCARRFFQMVRMADDRELTPAEVWANPQS
jgi:hypothetical protein